jgi:hypothetical protein
MHDGAVITIIIIISICYLGVILVIGSIALLRAPSTEIAAILRTIRHMLPRLPRLK